MQAVGILRALHEAGLSVPGDIALAAFDGSVEAEYQWPPLTTVEQPVRAMADAAVRALVGRAAASRPRTTSSPRSCWSGSPAAARRAFRQHR